MKVLTYALCLCGLLLVCESAQSPQKHWQQYHPKSLEHHKYFATAKTPNPATPNVTAHPATPKAPTNPPTPKATTKLTTPKATTKLTTPKATTKFITPKATTKLTTPKATTKLTTPKATTKLTTPKATTKPTTSKATTKLTTAKPTPPHCTPGQKVAVKDTCRDYIECDKSFKWVNMTCSTWCHNFNPVTAKCVWSWKYRCTDPTTASDCTGNDSTTTLDPATTSSTSTTTSAPETTTPTTTSAPETTTPTTTSAPQTTTLPTSKPTPSTIPPCSNGSKKVFKKGDCKDYLECDSGKWVKKSCSFGYDFDVNKLSCTWSWWAKC